jgi:S1-C subfamily serine protease
VTGRFAYFTVGLAACVSFLVGMVVTGSLTPSTATSAPSISAVRNARDDRPFMPGIAGVVNFADVAERLNPAVVNIDATSRRRTRAPQTNSRTPARPDMFEDPFDRRGRDAPRRGAGTGFLIDDQPSRDRRRRSNHGQVHRRP